jgi:thiol-disulfide isomerase/thioredoxin
MIGAARPRRPAGCVILRAGAGVLVGAVVFGAAAACGPTRTAPLAVADSPFASCAAATGAAPGSSAGSGVDGDGPRLPDVGLPCATGGATIRLAALGRPAVLNLWSSYCDPCRRELPQFQRFAESLRGRAEVLGVITSDTPSRAGSLARDLRISFPAVLDDKAELQRALGLNVLPITVFVAADGTVRHLDRSGALDFAKLSALTRLYLGIAVE